MDILTANNISTQLAIYVKKDYKHTLATGVVICLVFGLILFFSSNAGFKDQAPIIFSLIIVYFCGRAIYEMKRAFYLVNANNFNVKITEKEIEDVKEIQYFLEFDVQHIYACTRDYCELITTKKQLPPSFLINTATYNLVHQYKNVVMLLSSTNTLLGCYTKQTGFVAN